jgi:3-dehydroquinate dehydratase-2
MKAASSNKKKKPLKQLILVANGVNLDLLGRRQPEIYGYGTLHDLQTVLLAKLNELKMVGLGEGIDLDFFQSNHEAEYLEKVSSQSYLSMILNPGAWTHTSLALRDRLLALPCAFVEVHLSNPFVREDVRRHSLIGDLGLGVIAGFKLESYSLALDFLIRRLQRP